MLSQTRLVFTGKSEILLNGTSAVWTFDLIKSKEAYNEAAYDTLVMKEASCRPRPPREIVRQACCQPLSDIAV